jgi:hypothetical protein
MHPPPASHANPVKGPPHAFVCGAGAPPPLEPASNEVQVASLLGSRVQADVHRAIAPALGHA